jgi:phage gp29-like protein
LVIPRAMDRSMDIFQRRMEPQEVTAILEQSASGSLHGQHLLFQAMMDSWPRAQKCMDELKRAARKAPWKVVPFSGRRDEPTSKAQARADLVEDAIWKMNPDMQRRLKGFEGMVDALVEGYWTGHQVLDIIWDPTGTLPESVAVLSSRFYNYPWEGEDRLLFDPEGQGGSNLQEWPERKVLIATSGSHSGNPGAAARIRALTGWWLAATFGLTWFLSYCELFGQPIRWAEYAAGDEKARGQVERMMENIGSSAWGVFPSGTKLNFVESTKGAAGLPQKDLLSAADEQCAVLMLGQSLTSAVGDSGGNRALGEVHLEVRQDVVEGICDFVGEVLTHQLSRFICQANFGDAVVSEYPGIWALFEKPKDEKKDCEVMEAKLRMGIPMSESYVYEATHTPMPAKDDKLFQVVAQKETVPGKSEGDPADEDDAEDEEPRNKGKVKAGLANLTWIQVSPSSDTLGIPRGEMPQIASSNRAAMTSFLRARGIESRAEEVPAGSLKPTQAEYSPEKVAMALRWTGGNRSILISEDNHVVDGHHQWLAMERAGEPIKVIRLMAPIVRILMMIHRMPSTAVAAAESDSPSMEQAEKLFETMENALKEGNLLDWKTIAVLLSAGFVDGMAEKGDA